MLIEEIENLSSKINRELLKTAIKNITKEEFEKTLINQSFAAQLLGISRQRMSFILKRQDHNIKKDKNKLYLNDVVKYENRYKVGRPRKKENN